VAQFPAIWVDGEPASALPLPDRGLDFGDGLFETLLLRLGRPLFLDLHWDRLKAGLEVLGFPDCESHARQQLQQASNALAELPWAALRLTVSRGSGPRGYAPLDHVSPRIVISAAPLQQDRTVFPEAATLDWARIRWSSQPLLAGIKHLNRLEQVMAAREAQAIGSDEVVVLDQEGNVCSVAAGNLFAVVAGTLLTPALETCGIAGTRRRLIIEQLAPALGIEVEQVHLQPQQLLQADELLYCNSLRGLQPVKSLAGKHWEEAPFCKALHQQYLECMP
jgi:4-amino-4-deoxychorismate lyase